MQWKLFATLSEAAGGDVTVEADAEMSLREALEALLTAEPALRERVLDEDGGLREHIRLLHEGENPFEEGDGWDRTVGPDDELALFPPVSGG